MRITSEAQIAYGIIVLLSVVAAGVGILLCALLAGLVKMRGKIPGGVVAALACLGLGGVVGVVLMILYGSPEVPPGITADVKDLRIKLPDPDDLLLPILICLGGGVLVALLVTLLVRMRVHIPIALGASVLCLALGASVGAVSVMWNGYRFPSFQAEKMQGQIGGGGPPVKKGGGGGQKGGGLKKDGKEAAGLQPKGGALDPRAFLVFAVTKLDALTRSPDLNLDAGEKAAIYSALDGLETMDSLTREDAKKRGQEIMKVFSSRKDQLRSVGIRWPATDNTPPPVEGDNPFRQESATASLKSLRKFMAP